MDSPIIPLGIILVSLSVLLVIFFRRFPQIALLDVDNIPAVKEGKKKAEYLKKRVEKKGMEARARRSIQWQPIIQSAKNIQLSFRKYVGQIERRLIHERARVLTTATPEQKIEREDQLRSLIHEGQIAREQGDYDTAEKKFIAAIRIDAKNKDAYRGLADVYYVQGQFAEAKETYSFLLSIDPEDDNVMVKLAELAEKDNAVQEAIEYYEKAVLLNDHFPMRFAKLAELLAGIGQYVTALEAIGQAVDLEPQNPKYLDMLVEISIMVGDKELAERSYRDLRMVNPENQKLAVFRDRIQKM